MSSPKPLPDRLALLAVKLAAGHPAPASADGTPLLTVEDLSTIAGILSEHEAMKKQLQLFAERGTGYDTQPTLLFEKSTTPNEVYAWLQNCIAEADRQVREAARKALTAASGAAETLLAA